MASRGRGARQKGASFEREIAKILSSTGFVFKRGLGQARGGGQEIADVTCDLLPELHFELKCQQRPNITGAYEQALRDAPQKIKIVITKADRAPTLVTMELTEWLPLFTQWVQPPNAVSALLQAVSSGDLEPYFSSGSDGLVGEEGSVTCSGSSAISSELDKPSRATRKRVKKSSSTVESGTIESESETGTVA